MKKKYIVLTIDGFNNHNASTRYSKVYQAYFDYRLKFREEGYETEEEAEKAIEEYYDRHPDGIRAFVVIKKYVNNR